jgi:HEAT repeat protein
MLQGLMLGLVLLAVPPAVQGESPGEVLTKVLERPDAATAEMFEAIAAQGDEKALEALQECMRVISNHSVFAKCVATLDSFGADPELRIDAMKTLLGVILETSPYMVALNLQPRLERDQLLFEQLMQMIQIEATRTLLAYGADAAPYLRQLLQDAPVASIEHLAISGLGEHLARSNTKDDLELFLAHYSPGFSGTMEAGAKVLASFSTEIRNAPLVAILKRKGSRDQVSAMVLLALAQGGVEDLESLLMKHLNGDVELLQRIAVEQLDALGVTGHDRKLQRIVGSSGVRSRALRLSAFKALARCLYATRNVEDLRELLFRAVDSKRHELRVGAARNLALLRSAAAEAKLVELLADEAPEVRLAAIEGALELRVTKAIPVLIELLETDGLGIRTQAKRALELLTGLDHGSGGRWRLWWDTEHQSFELPSRSGAERMRNERAARPGSIEERTTVPPTFFDLPLKSDRIAFVLDRSGSMTSKMASGQSRNAVVLGEALETLSVLEDTAMVNVVFFTTKAWSWRESLDTLHPRNRRSLRSFLQTQGDPAGGTDLLQGTLRALMDPKVEELVLLTDGFTVKEEATLDRLLRELEVRACRVHTVSVGGRSLLLTALSEATGGSARVL